MSVDHTFIPQKQKQNVPFRAIPFCVERETLTRDDSLHTHDFCQLTIITGGSAEIVINGNSLSVGEGDVYIIGGFSIHYLRNTKKLQYINILFDQKDLVAVAGDLKNDSAFTSLFIMQPSVTGTTASNHVHIGYETLQTVLNLVDTMLAEIRTAAPGSDVMTNASFLALVVRLVRAYTRKNAARRREENPLAKAVHHMEKHYTEEIAIRDLAQLCHMSERQFRANFQARYNCSPKQYLITLRIRRAGYLLEHTELSIGEVAEACGFEDSSYFSRLFRRKMGVAPKRYTATPDDTA